MPEHEHASREEYESTFNSIEVALRDMDAYEDWQETFEQAKEQTLADESMDTETQAGFARMLVDLYSEAADIQATYREDKERAEDKATEHRREDKEKQRVDAKRRAYEKGNKENAYRHDREALLDGMDLLGTLSEKINAAELEEEAERKYDAMLRQQDGDKQQEEKGEATP